MAGDFPGRVALEQERLEACRIRLAFCYGREAAVEIEATARERAEKSIRGFYETLPEIEREYQLAHPGWSSRPVTPDTFTAAAELVMRKNAGLYDRLAAARKSDG